MGVLVVVDQLLNGAPQAVAASATNQAVSNQFEIGPWESTNFAFEITVASVTGTAGIVKPQVCFDNVAGHFVDVDSTHAKVTIGSGAGRYPLLMNPGSSNFAADMPLPKYVRFVATTTSADAFTVTSVKVLKQTVGSGN